MSRFAPSSLLPLVAEFTARHDPNNHVRPNLVARAPWAYSAIARESILHGSEQGATNATRNSVQRLHDVFVSVFDPPPTSGVAAIVGPLAYEQFPYQESTFAELARVQALLISAPRASDIRWEEEFGVPLADALTGTMILHTWVGKNQGRYDPELLDSPQLKDIFTRVLPRDHFEAVARALTATVEEGRVLAGGAQQLPPALERYGFNPLAARPLVDLGSGSIVAPQTLLVPRALTVGNLFYRGVQRWGTDFTNKLGHLVEAYVGAQLRSLRAGQVHAEVLYGSPQRASVDWIWVMPSAVILLECKSARLLHAEKAGAIEPTRSVDHYLRKARKQIDETADRIGERHLAFAHIPTDRPLIGLTVTAEPFYLGNARLAEYQAPGATPTYVISLRELENLFQHPPDDIAATLLTAAHAGGGSPWTLADLAKTLPRGAQNAVLAAAWASMNSWQTG